MVLHGDSMYLMYVTHSQGSISTARLRGTAGPTTALTTALAERDVRAEARMLILILFDFSKLFFAEILTLCPRSGLGTK